METCRVSILLANMATVYIFASVYYILSTRHLGTPFKNEIKKYPKIMKIKHGHGTFIGSILNTTTLALG